jgi:hypothetical protein
MEGEKCWSIFDKANVSFEGRETSNARARSALTLLKERSSY